MREIVKNLFIGDDNACIFHKGNMAIIHACKTCHQKGVGYNGNLLSSHPNYLILVKGEHLYLNMVDMKQELLPRFTHPMMQASVSFIEKFIATKAFPAPLQSHLYILQEKIKLQT